MGAGGGMIRGPKKKELEAQLSIKEQESEMRLQENLKLKDDLEKARYDFEGLQKILNDKDSLLLAKEKEIEELRNRLDEALKDLEENEEFDRRLLQLEKIVEQSEKLKHDLDEAKRTIKALEASNLSLQEKLREVEGMSEIKDSSEHGGDAPDSLEEESWLRRLSDNF